VKFVAVTTTINKPTLVEEYSSDLEWIIIGDNKTPPSVAEYCSHHSNVQYWSPKEQDAWIKTFLPNHQEKIRIVVPENDIRRRNIGFLMALKNGADVIISLDDDNYPLPGDDWLESLKCAFEEKQGYNEACSKNKIINPCNILIYGNEYVYSRGYPLSSWYTDSFSSCIVPGSTRVMMHQMLWTNKPDVDAYSNLIYPNLKMTGFIKPVGFIGYENPKPYLVAGERQYFPVDTQSLAFRKELAIFHALYQEPLFGLPSHRYDDIWAGLICQRLINRFGDGASFGAPLVEHRRNTHDFVKDLQTEFVGSAVNAHMWKSVMEMFIESKDYKGGFIEIADKLPAVFRQYDSRVYAYICRLGESMRLWVEILEELGV
jgi:hypothetical protein